MVPLLIERRGAWAYCSAVLPEERMARHPIVMTIESASPSPRQGHKSLEFQGQVTIRGQCSLSDKTSGKLAEAFGPLCSRVSSGALQVGRAV